VNEKSAKGKVAVKIIACIEDPVVIQKILDHLKAKEGELDAQSNCLSPTRAIVDRNGSGTDRLTKKTHHGRCGHGDCRAVLACILKK